MSEVVLHYTRAGHVENIHRGDIAAVNCAGEVVHGVGNAYLPMFWRSAAKPFQALPFVKNGGLEKYNISEEELAILVSSHSGEENHVELVRGILKKLGLDETVLDCGVLRPLNGKAYKKLLLAGEPITAVHNQCSGKHSQIIALAIMLGVPVEGYIRPEHPAQKLIFKHVAMASKMPEEKLEIGIDGCGVPVFYLPLYNMALAYARLSTPKKGDWGEYELAATKIRDAMSKYPQVVSGTGRIDLAVPEVTKGRIIAKIGSDAVYCLAVKDEDLGIAFKIEDGSFAAITPMVIAVLKKFDLLTKDEADELDKKFPPTLKNHRGEIIGTIETVF
ncbi:MAG: asparaginase [Selenomonadaceae bacterium]|nr:asparaginase [Selenomonadaceae bacterium]